MIRDDVFVFDNVAHMYDDSDENLKHADNDFKRLFGSGIEAKKKEFTLLENSAS